MERRMRHRERNPFERMFMELYNLDEKQILPNIFGVEKGNDKNKDYTPSFPIKVKEDKEKYYITAEVPGVDKENIDIEYDEKDKKLTIKVEKKEEENKNEETVHFSYISYGTFEESVLLPEEINKDEIEAKYENGVLKIIAPKKVVIEETKKKIPVS